jgi:poly(A) polymerase
MPPWLRTPALRRLVRAIESAGGTARLGGGAVRGILRKEARTDLDIATDLTPSAVMRAMRRARLRCIPTGIEHGTVTVLAGVPVEVTTLRQDVETFGRHARVAFTESWFEDAVRRDLTINALYAGLDGLLFDPVGGLADLKAGRVRFVGDAQRRIDEDALRILRFFRFAERYGRGAVDAAGLAACTRSAAALDRLSGERIAAEMMKLLGGRRPVAVLQVMAARGILVHLALQHADVDALARLVVLPDATARLPLIRLAALLDGRDAAAAVAARWRLSNADRDRLARLCGTLPVLSDARAIRRAHYTMGSDDLLAAGLLAHARRISVDLDSIRRIAFSGAPPVLPVRGADLIARGIAPGPQLGTMLRAIESWWIENDFAADRDACLAALENRLAQGA